MKVVPDIQVHTKFRWILVVFNFFLYVCALCWVGCYWWGWQWVGVFEWQGEPGQCALPSEGVKWSTCTQACCTTTVLQVHVVNPTFTEIRSCAERARRRGKAGKWVSPPHVGSERERRFGSTVLCTSGRIFMKRLCGALGDLGGRHKICSFPHSPDPFFETDLSQ